jgi:hypothetical protein
MRIVLSLALWIAPMAATAMVVAGMSVAVVVAEDGGEIHASEKTPPGGDPEGNEFFEKRIRPVLVRHCYECHSAASVELKGGLRLDSREGLLEGGESGPAIAPGRPDESLLIEAVRYESLEMPPAGPLPAAVVKDLIEWVERGAPDPRQDVTTPADAQAAAWQAQFSERVKWWSLQPLVVVHPPTESDDALCRRPIDSFVAARLAQNGLEPARETDRVTLVRRLTFALLGLPPSPEEVEVFREDSSPAAWERLIDRLMASPHFGERWARHWMDVVRYSDTYGYEWDIPAKGAWRYRDYLIRALNADVPLDQLVREQIAGDLLERPRIDPVEQINESLAGVMFYQMGEKRHGDSAEFNGIHQEMLDNKIDAFSKAFQAMTVSCSRCHDHRLDPVSQREYYALAGVLMSSRWVTNTLDTEARNAEVFEELRGIKHHLRRLLAEYWVGQLEWLGGKLDFATSEAISAQGKQKAASAEAQGESAEAGETAEALELPLESPLYPWRAVIRGIEQGQTCDETWRDLAVRYAEESRERSAANARRFEVLVDFSAGGAAEWSLDGVGLRQTVACGDFTVALEGQAAVDRILPGGLFTHSLSPRLNGAVRTPYLNRFERAYISFEACGGDFSAHRTVVDNAFLTERQVYLKHPQLDWIQLSTFPEMRDRRIYVEWATKTSNPNFPPRVGLGGECSEEQAADPRSWFGLRRVLLHDEPGPPADELTRFAALLAGEPPKDLAEVTTRFAGWLREALEAWREDRASPDDVWLINWMLDRGILCNGLDDPAAREIAVWVERYRHEERRIAPPQTVNGMCDMDPGVDYRLNVRGDYDELGEPVPRGYLRAVARMVPCKGVVSESGRFAGADSGRMALAELVASPANPLTARVFVNRCWHWLFGVGLVDTPDNFGHLGSRPSHPELLDYMTGRFIEHGWSIKQLIRAVVSSRTWRQAGSAADEAAARRLDPTNRLLHHFPVRRLEAEAIRDAMLAVSGRLDRRLYGPPVLPHRYKEDPQKRLFSGPVDGNGRRSIYTMMTIMEPPRFLATFNQPSPKVPTGKRDVTNTPLQSLALLNDPLVASQADQWARQLLQIADSDAVGRIRRMFLASLGRDPSPDETQLWTTAATRLASAHQVSDDVCLASLAVWRDIAHMLLNTKEFVYVR